MMANEDNAQDERIAVLQDLGNRVARSTVAVIDTVVQRGGFKGEELSTIGQLRDQAIEVIQLVEQLQGD
jgi:predicted transcriptional regulator